MKTAVTFLLLILGMNSAKAESLDYTTQQRHFRVKNALKTLIEEGALVFPENEYPQIEPSLLDELRNKGTIKPSEGTTTSSICVVPS